MQEISMAKPARVLTQSTGVCDCRGLFLYPHSRTLVFYSRCGHYGRLAPVPWYTSQEGHPFAPSRDYELGALASPLTVSVDIFDNPHPTPPHPPFPAALAVHVLALSELDAICVPF